MDIERKFEDLGVDAITGVNLMRLLNLGPDDFIDPTRFERFHDVIKYFKDMPDVNYIVTKLAVGKPVDRLDHVWGYVELARQKAALKDETKGIMDNIDTFSKLGDATQVDVVDGLNKALSSKLVEAQKVNEQMAAYER